jgi:uncharacterized protein (DUF111 family)
MRIAYFDCFAGISGEMLLGALLGAGLPLDALQSILSGLALPCYELCAERVIRKELLGTYVRITPKGPVDNGQAPRESELLADMARPGSPEHVKESVGCDQAYPPAQIIGKSRLPDLVRETSLAIFRRLAQAEAAVLPQNGKAHTAARPIDEIVMVAGVVAGLWLLGINRVECSPIQVGSGVLYNAEGMRPALSPVAVEILRTASVPVYGSYIAGELVSPAGLAIITTIASAFGAMPTMKIDSVGYGAGKHDFKETPGLVRVFIGETESAIGQLYMAPDYSRAQPEGTSTGTASSTLLTNGIEDGAAEPASAPPSENLFSTNHHDWTALEGKGLQQSGRQRLA